MWNEFLSFGDQHPWLLQGLVFALFVALIVWRLNQRKEWRNFKHAAMLIALEYNRNQAVMVVFIQGGPPHLECLKFEAWESHKSELLPNLSADQVYEAVILQETLNKLKGRSGNICGADLEEVKCLHSRTIKIFETLEKKCGYSFPQMSDKEMLELLGYPYTDVPTSR